MRRPTNSFFLTGLALALCLTGVTAKAAQAPTGTIPAAVVAEGKPVQGGAAAPSQGPTVASTRTARPVDDQALPVTLIGRDQIERSMLAAPGDVLRSFNLTPGAYVQTTSPVLGTATVRLQGLPGRYTRLFFDGVPQFFDRPGGYALLRIPTMDLAGVEVIKGPTSSLFGPDALGGAVNFLSRAPGAEPSREFLFNQSARGATDAVLWLATPAGGPARTWSSTFLFGAHRQEETDGDDDGWSDLPGYERVVARPRVFWTNRKGRSVSGVANTTIETREGGSATAREALETKTADGAMFGEMILDNGYVVTGAGSLFVQSRTRDFSDGREGDRLQMATIEITLRRPGARHTWLAGVAADWYALRSAVELPTKYVSTRPGIFFHDDLRVADWLVISGSARLDHHNLYGLLLSPRGSALVGNGPWAARVSAGQGYFTPRPLTEETEAAGLARLRIDGPLEVETARNVSADVTYKTRATAVTVAVFRTQIDDPAQVDRTTYTLRTEADPIVARGVEFSGRATRGPLAVTGAYTFVRTRERGGRELALTPRHRASLLASAESDRGRLGVEILFTGEQRLDANPYRSTSEPFVLVGVLGERRFGRWRLFVNAENLTDVRQTDWDPIARPARNVDGRLTVDAWAPLAGRVISGGIRISF